MPAIRLPGSGNMTQIDFPILVRVYLNRAINPRRLKSPNSIAGHGRARKENTVSFLVLTVSLRVNGSIGICCPSEHSGTHCSEALGRR